MTPTETLDIPDLKLGKTDARPGAASLELASYMPVQLPSHPTVFGHYDAVSEYPMLANEDYGDCVEAGADHETQIFVAEGHGTVTFTNDTVLSDYHDITGWTADDPDSDQGTDMVVAAGYRRRTGMLDAAGNRHRIAAYTALRVGDDNQVETAAFLFGAVGIGWQLPESAMLAFRDRRPFTVSKTHTNILGGHYMCVVGADADWLYVITWGRVVAVSRAFLRKYMDEGLAYFSTEMLWGGRSPENVDAAGLLYDLRHVTTVHAPAPSQTVSRGPVIAQPPTPPRAGGMPEVGTTRGRPS